MAGRVISSIVRICMSQVLPSASGRQLPQAGVAVPALGPADLAKRLAPKDAADWHQGLLGCALGFVESVVAHDQPLKLGQLPCLNRRPRAFQQIDDEDR